MALRIATFGMYFFCVAPVWCQDIDFAPLTAIDWLSESVEQPDFFIIAPVLGTKSIRAPDVSEVPVTNSAIMPDVSVIELSDTEPRILGLLPPSSTGLPTNLWDGSDTATLIELLQAGQINTLPAIQELFFTLTITQANPPRETAIPDAFLLARVDKLLDLGALEPAQAMLQAATPDSPNLFRRWFDVSLLTGTEDEVCQALSNKPDLAPTQSALIFCLARSGDWSAAALTLNTVLALGDIDVDTGALIARFLDPDLYEGEQALKVPERTTPLTFRMFEAIGFPLTTSDLPRAFSHADLRANVGWKAQLEAAERLSRAGAISDNALLGLYTAMVPAASGGVWERAKAVNALNTALAGNNSKTTYNAVSNLWREARPVGVLVPLSRVFSRQLIDADIGHEGTIVFKLLLLSDQYEQAALIENLSTTDAFLAATARGDPSETFPIHEDYFLIQNAFVSNPNSALIKMARQGRIGEAILRALATLQNGIDGDQVAFKEGFATLRALGLEDVARRVALQYLLLP
ncbi:MAG: hypothetical protein OSA51_05640 [Octadecabacter sp.]|nr:hypothetical protein [Octadecabacter sp.]